MKKPLEGMTVLDFTQAYSGPYCAMNLADFGARIIKVERKGSGDQSRFWAPFDEKGYSGYFSIYNRNKESISLDLRLKEGKDIILNLFKEADVVLENFKYGSLDKLGIGYEAAKEVNPQIIFASITGFGQDGPLKKKSAYDNIIESMCGFMEITGFPENPPLRSGASVADSYAGLMMTLAISIAYYNKKLTGKGQRIDVAMLDAMFSTIDDAVLAYGVNGRILSRTGNARPNQFAPYDLYECKDGYITVGILDEKMWNEFCESLEQKELLDDPDFASNELRCNNIEKLTQKVSKLISKYTVSEIIGRMSKYSFPIAPVNTPKEAMKHEQLVERDMIVPIKDSGIGEFESFGIPVHMSKTPGGIKKSAPLLGEDTEKILKEIGYSKKEIEDLINKNVVESI